MIPAVKKLAVYAGTFIILTSASGLAWASGVTIPTTFTGGTPALASEVNGNFSAVKTAVDDNDTRITGVMNNNLGSTLKSAVDANTSATTANTTAITAITGTNTTQTTDIDNLKGNLTGGTCKTNNLSDEMVRVGPICVDKNKASLWNSTAAGATQVTSTAGCSADGITGCAGIFAQSRLSVTPADGTLVTWAQAQRACINAGKRLLTPGEWIATFSSGLANGMIGASNENKQEYIDMINGATASEAQVGYIGRTTLLSLEVGSNLDWNELPGNTVVGYFRCAR